MKVVDTCSTSCWGEDDKTVESRSMLFLATLNASFESSAKKPCTGTLCCSRLALTSASGTERAGVNTGAKLSSSRPGNRIPLDLKLF